MRPKNKDIGKLIAAKINKKKELQQLEELKKKQLEEEIEQQRLLEEQSKINVEKNKKKQRNTSVNNKNINKLSKYGVSINNKTLVPPKNNNECLNKTHDNAPPSIINKNDNLKSPIVCVIGHVDAGKTSLLDKLRGTNIQKNEVGGITQKISASWVSIEQLTKFIKINTKKKYDITIPGLLIIDTPGHDTFTNMRSRGTSICDIVILVINITKGIQLQTIECIKLLQLNNIPFIIALNKIDKVYKWISHENETFINSFKKQSKNVVCDFNNTLSALMFELGKYDINSKLYYEIKNLNEAVPIVPISAKTNEGISELLMLLTQYAQKKLKSDILFNDNFEGTVIEINHLEGYGYVVNVLVINGIINKGDNILVNSMSGILNKTAKFLITVNHNKDLMHNDTLKATNYVSLVFTDSTDVDKILIGSSIYVSTKDNYNTIINNLSSDYDKLKSYINDKEGIFLTSSTMGTLESILILLKNNNIPVHGFTIGQLTKVDITKINIMAKKNNKYNVILAFDIDFDEKIELEAKNNDIIIIKDNIVYNLVKKITEHFNNKLESYKTINKEKIVYPCILEILPQYIFNKKDPIIIGVKIINGELHKNTKICVPSKNIIVGTIKNIQNNNKDVDIAKINDEVAISISSIDDKKYVFGRHFDESDKLYSNVTRESIDLMKELFREYVIENITLFNEIKQALNIK